MGSHFELREIATNKMIASFDPTLGQNNQPVDEQKIPAWAADLMKK